MSSMTARLQAMIATLDDRVWPYPMTPSAIEECRQAMDQINAATSPTLRKTPTGVKLTIGEITDAGDIRDWVDAFFSHPERIQIKRFEVKR